MRLNGGPRPRASPPAAPFPWCQQALIEGRTQDPHGYLPPRVPRPRPRVPLFSLLMQRCVEDSRALHLVAIQFLTAARLLRPHADVRARELLLFILSFFSCLLPWEGRRGSVRHSSEVEVPVPPEPQAGRSASLPQSCLPYRPCCVVGPAHPAWG